MQQLHSYSDLLGETSAPSPARSLSSPPPLFPPPRRPSAQIQNQAPLGGGSGQKLVASSRLQHSATFSQADGDLDVFNPSSARDMQATIANLSDASVRAETQREGRRAPDFEMIPAGITVTRE